MYKKNDLVVYENKGVCEIADIQEMDFGSGAKKYYVLSPSGGGGTIYTPVNNPKVSMRPVISKKEAMDIIENIETVSLKTFDGLRSMELESKYRECIRSYNCSDMIRLEMSIYRKCKTARKAGKKVTELDDKYYKHLNDLINGEMSVALGIPKEEVPEFIASRIGKRK